MVPDDYQWLLVVVYAVFPQSHIWKLRLVPFKIYEWIIPFIITPFIWERWISYHRACPPFEDWQERAFTVGIGGPVGSGKILGAAQVSVLWMISMWNKQLIHGIWVDEWVYSLYRFYSFFVFNTGYTYVYIYINWNVHPGGANLLGLKIPLISQNQDPEGCEYLTGIYWNWDTMGILRSIQSTWKAWSLNISIQPSKHDYLTKRMVIKIIHGRWFVFASSHSSGYSLLNTIWHVLLTLRLPYRSKYCLRRIATTPQIIPQSNYPSDGT